MEMMPGMSGMAAAMGQGGADMNVRTKRWMVLMDSMTDAEMDGEVEIDEPRARRICRGAGHATFDELRAMLQTYKTYEKMVGSMQKSGLLSNEAKLNKQMKRDPKAVMAQLQKSMDPRILSQLGGAGNMMELMKSMGGGGGPGGGMGGPGGMGAGGMPPNLAGLMGGDMGKKMQQMMGGDMGKMLQQMMGGAK
jgi:signal recognition particle subunit SRP54